MFRRITVLAVVCCLAVLSAANTATAQVGQPIGTFNITVMQGGTTIVNHDVSIGAGGDLSDLLPSWVDGTPESFTQVGVIGPSGSSSPIILKVTSDGGPDEPFRVLHWYLDVPVSTSDIYTAGPYSLFDPLGGNIEVSVSGFQFSNGADATPQLVDNDTYLASFMRDYQGHFYESVQANAYNVHGNGIYDIQVPGMAYLDGDPGMYTFASTSGTSSSWTWGGIVNPGLLTTIHNGTTGGLTPLIPGYVFELGASVAFAAVPEPATMALMLPALFLLRRRR
jgi:hypothetical protein